MPYIILLSHIASILLHNHSAKAEKMDMSVMAKSEKDMSIAKSEKVKSDGE